MLCMRACVRLRGVCVVFAAAPIDLYRYRKYDADPVGPSTFTRYSNFPYPFFVSSLCGHSSGLFRKGFGY